MRISPTLQVCSGLLSGLLIVLAGCGNPSSQTLDSLTVTATPSSIPVGGAAVLKAVAHLSDGTTQDVTAGTQWTLSNGTIATIGNGAITAKAQGTLTVQAAYVEVTPAGSSPASATASPQNLSASAQVTITAAGASGAMNVPAITWNAPAAITYGTALSSTQLSATANVAGTITYTPAAGTTLKAGKQTLSATFIPTDTKTYSAATASVQLTVNQAAPTITWATPAPIATGTALSATQLDATASVPGSVMYNPAVGAVLAAGTQQLTAVFSPTDTTDYSSATAHTSLVVGATSGPTGGPVQPPTPVPPTPGPTAAGGCQLSSGASVAQIQTAINSAASNSCAAPSTSTVNFGAGRYAISSQINVPCPTTAMTIQGPSVGYVHPASLLPGSYSYTSPYTAILTGSLTSSSGWNVGSSSCKTPITIQNFEWNGGQPSSGGGGWMSVVGGTSNLTVQNNYAHGNWANTSTSHDYDDQIGLEGVGQSQTPIDTNVQILWNVFGDGTTDCNPIMNLLAYQGGSYVSSGGYCGGIGIHASTTNLLVQNNDFEHLEQPMKFFQGSSAPNDITHTYMLNNALVDSNDYGQWHRIAIEGQQAVVQNNTTGGVFTFTNNSMHDPIDPQYGFFGASLPMCCSEYSGYSTADNQVNCNNNNMVDNVLSPSFTGYAFEWWSTGSCNNNLMQGHWNENNGNNSPSGGGVGWGDSNIVRQWVASNNTCQFTIAGGTCVGNEAEGYTTPPTQSGNVTNTGISTVASIAPTILPASGSQSYPLTVTLTDPGYTSGSLPQGHTGVWYTTDGSSPVPGSGTAKYLASGGTFTLQTAATVKAVGMWGTLNQPSAYPSGYGYVPSAVVTASFTAGSVAKPAAAARISNTVGEAATAPAGGSSPVQGGAAASELQSVAIAPSQPAVGVGSTTQLKAIATFNDGSVKDVTAEFGWQSSDARTMTANESGLLNGLASGPAIISGSYQGLQASVSASSSIGEVDWSGPIVISQGGTYTGNWQSTDIKTPAVTVATTAPVRIENSHIRSVGNLIKTSVAGSNLTVRNSLGVALNAAVKGQPNGNFLEVASPARLDVENNYIENAQGGVIVTGYAGNRDGEQTIVIRANRARNLNGLLSDGNGGYLPGEGSNRSLARFIQLDSVRAVPGIDVGWNEVINYPGRSLVADDIDVYQSSGTPNRPLEIHDTYIQGAYPYRVAQDEFTGGGITTEGSPNETAQDAPAFNSIHDNQVVGTVNYGIKFAAGHDNIAANNRVISSGLLSDGTKIAAQGVGLANGGLGGASASMYNNTMRDNLVGWTCWKSSCAQDGYRKDQFFPGSPADYSTNSVVAPRQITFNMENNEYQVWLNKMSAAAVTVGPAF